MDATVKYKCPYIDGNAQRAGTSAVKANPDKFSHVFQFCPSEVNYGWTYPLWLEDEEKRGVWKPKNRKVHIIQEQIGYCQTISRAAQEAIKKRGKFEVARITDIQYPVQDWAPIIREMQEVDAAAIMVDHWVAAEYAAFCKLFVASPVRDSLVYLQYGPSQPEFLELAGSAANGFVWGTTMGIYGDERGLAYRQKYKKRFPGIAGACLYRHCLRPDLLPQEGLGGCRRSPKVQGSLRLDSRQSAARCLRLRRHGQSLPGGAPLPR